MNYFTWVFDRNRSRVLITFLILLNFLLISYSSFIRFNIRGVWAIRFTTTKATMSVLMVIICQFKGGNGWINLDWILGSFSFWCIIKWIRMSLIQRLRDIAILNFRFSSIVSITIRRSMSGRHLNIISASIYWMIQNTLSTIKIKSLSPIVDKRTSCIYWRTSSLQLLNWGLSKAFVFWGASRHRWAIRNYATEKGWPSLSLISISSW